MSDYGNIEPCPCCGQRLGCYCHEHPHPKPECPGAEQLCAAKLWNAGKPSPRTCEICQGFLGVPGNGCPFGEVKR